MLHSMGGEEVKAALQSAFQAVDVDQKGWLTLDEVYEVLQMFGTDTVQLEPYQINAMVSAVDENDDGMVEWEELVDFVYDVLMHLDRDMYVMEVAAEAAAEGYGGDVSEDENDSGGEGGGMMGEFLAS